MQAALYAADANRQFGRGLARAFAGAIIFGLPILMTMEMWALGFNVDDGKLALLLALFFPVLVALSWHAGFEKTFSWRDDVLDALVAYAVGFVASAAILAVLGQLEGGMSAREIVGKIALQAVPASIGALLAQSMLGDNREDREVRGGVASYAAELFVMGAGALFLAFNLAPTEEILLIGVRLSPLQAAMLMLATLALMHAFVYGVSFTGHHGEIDRGPAWSVALRFTVPGYAIALLLCAYVLWTFGTLGGMSAAEGLNTIAVLGFPAGVGAAAARLIL
ncbi:TIGR02587 family membrane protein [Ramlibacter sp.]|uniref:TIGR02587 family membrane protein n=1 Tax=Ramlibacter sp. TaxID=1917967 RepID=UPI003D0F7358